MTTALAAELPADAMLAATGITYAQLNHWTVRGYLRATGTACPGSGRPRTWPADEVPVARAMRRLTAAGLSPAAAERAARGAPLAPGVRVLVIPDDVPVCAGCGSPLCPDCGGRG